MNDDAAHTPKPPVGDGTKKSEIRGTGASLDAEAPAGATLEERDWLGRELDGRYRIVRKLGEGGMGAVFVAEHLTLMKEVALKVILPQIAGEAEFAARFAREAMASARLDHPHVASALDYGQLPEGGAYLVMQLVPGDSLQNLIERGTPLPWPQAAAIAAQVADALTAAHSAGIVHRDLKPDNVMLQPRDDGSDLVKVLDFGIARVPSDDEPAPAGAATKRALTRIGTVMGTPGYMAPEQAMGEVVDLRADLYALGVILWESLAGRELYSDLDLTAIVTRQLTEDPVGIRTVNATVPAELDELITNLLARKPEDRPPSAGAVRDTLRQLTLRASLAGEVGSGTLPMVADPSGQWATQRSSAEWPIDDSTGAGPAAPRTQTMSAGSPVAKERHVHLMIGAVVGGVLFLGTVGLVGSMLFGDDADASANADAGVMEALLEAVPVGPPPEVEERIETLLTGSRKRARRNAARWLRNHEPADEVPAWARAAADLEFIQSCRNRRTALAAVVEADDARAIPVVQRLIDRPTRGCGTLNLRDCLGCMRTHLDEALVSLSD